MYVGTIVTEICRKLLTLVIQELCSWHIECQGQRMKIKRRRSPSFQEASHTALLEAHLSDLSSKKYCHSNINIC